MKKEIANARNNSQRNNNQRNDSRKKSKSKKRKLKRPRKLQGAAEGREKRLEKLAKNHILASMGVGLIPLPLVDLLALTGIQLDMIKKLAAEYDIPFKKDIGKSILSSLMGGLLPVELGGIVASMIKFIPVIGQTTGRDYPAGHIGRFHLRGLQSLCAAFRIGGTFLDMNPSKVKAFFCEQFGKGKKGCQRSESGRGSDPGGVIASVGLGY